MKKRRDQCASRSTRNVDSNHKKYVTQPDYMKRQLKLLQSSN